MDREIYEADVWVNELRYHTPMAIGNGGAFVYAGDLVTFVHEDGTTLYAKVISFVQQVCSNQFHVQHLAVWLLSVLSGNIQRTTGQVQAQVYLIITERAKDGEEYYVVIVDMANIDVATITSVITESHPFTRTNTYIYFKDSEESTPLTDSVITCIQQNTISVKYLYILVA